MKFEQNISPEEIEASRSALRELFHAYVEGDLPASLWLPVERLLEQLAVDSSAAPVPAILSSELQTALARSSRSNLPMAAASAPTVPLVLTGEQIGIAYGIALDIGGRGELIQVEAREVELRRSDRSRATIHTYGPLARVVAIDGGIVANSQFTDSIRRIERMLEKYLPGQEILVECEVSYLTDSDPSHRRTIEGASLSGAVALAILSRLYERPLLRSLAASFTVGSDGTIGSVDRADEKARVARKRGIDHLILPATSRVELAGIEPRLVPAEILFIRHIDELWMPEVLSGSEPASQPVQKGFWGNLRDRQALRRQLSRSGRLPSIIITSGPNRGDTNVFK